MSATPDPSSTPELTDSQAQGLWQAGQPPVHGATWVPPSVASLQASLPQFQVQAFIARGGMGAVYRAVQPALERTVAIKVLPPELARLDPAFSLRFQQEARAMARLKHPRVVTVHEAGETHDGLPYLVMELVEGMDLAQWLKSTGPLPQDEAIRITAQVCDALAYMHSQGVIHRDIKPSNIMVGPEGQVKVMDFGLARQPLQAGESLTLSDVAVGSPDFIAPEAFSPGLSLDGRADVYAVGVLLYQMLTGHLPKGRFALPTQLRRDAYAGLDRVVDRALQTDRDQRYPSVHEMQQDLSSLYLEKPTAAPSPWTRRRLTSGLIVSVATATTAAAWFWLRPAAPPPAMASDSLPWINLTTQMDPVLDRFWSIGRVGKNQWHRQGTDFVYTPDGRVGKLICPGLLECGDFDLEICYTPTSPDIPLYVDFPKESQQGLQNGVCSIELSSRRILTHGRVLWESPGATYTPGKRLTIRLEIRNVLEARHLRVGYDGRWLGKAEIGPVKKVRGGLGFGMDSGATGLTVHHFKLLPGKDSRWIADRSLAFHGPANMAPKDK
ncbi:serine/threonine-protein kinase [Prosthecobacter dejongeii]|uniref:Serine/threonine protein kinase n=1 Tax=Prosthecobacter dejongeii TaxID=48465 RepID=A0A7W7YHG5_9BACT|nr:serine/threonine-protein kinase [Prosthecobacter dejongeii]MBB5036278.1 serine/threonine protein kinase [Prosthecobacter dejongeii]